MSNVLADLTGLSVSNISAEPLFSIIIPTYNRGERLKICLDSLVNQTYRNFEVIICDDGSNDNTKAVVESYNVKLNLIYLWEENWGGPAKPRNRGIAKAQGEWICFLDSDDWWTPNKLQVCYESIKSNVDLIYHDITLCRGKSRKGIRVRKMASPILIDLLVKGNEICNSSVVVRKNILSIIGGINEDKKMISSEDYNTWLRISQLTDNFVHIPKKLGFYNIHEQGISQKDSFTPTRFASAEFLIFLDESQRKKHEAFIAYKGGRYEYKNKFYKNAKSNLLYSLRHGNVEIKVKSLFMLLFLSFKH